MKFSIVTICWNDLDGLKQTHQTVHTQTFRDYEWIVVDGASEDGTPEWLRDNVPSEVWTSEPDRGLYDAMNKGLDRATGEWILFLNSGDRFAAPDVLERTARWLIDSPTAEFLYGDSLDVFPNGIKRRRQARDHSKVWYGMFTRHQAMFFRGDRAASLRHDLSLSLSADYAFVCAYLRPAGGDRPRTVRLPFPVCEFDMGGISNTSRRLGIQQDFVARRVYLRQPWVLSALLWGAHRVHQIMKEELPRLTGAMRYRD